MLPMYSVRSYNYLVSVKTSITLPEDLLEAIDGTGTNRSAFMERPLITAQRRHRVHANRPARRNRATKRACQHKNHHYSQKRNRVAR